ncbi:MAG TPA: hypothetical protein VG326_09975 [Tepidisphaeraceae bacterium]|jgi:hypothetical protein|nr:hypothetical protein [Tepidisphaeraceae bacterium]
MNKVSKLMIEGERYFCLGRGEKQAEPSAGFFFSPLTLQTDRRVSRPDANDAT